MGEGGGRGPLAVAPLRLSAKGDSNDGACFLGQNQRHEVVTPTQGSTAGPVDRGHTWARAIYVIHTHTHTNTHTHIYGNDSAVLY